MRQIVFGRSVQGASHIRSGTACQDSFRKEIREDGAVILSVADGHGSKTCPFSREGAETAVGVFCDVIRNLCEGYAENPGQLFTYLNREGDTRISRAIDAEWKKRILERHREHRREIPAAEGGEEDPAGVYLQYGTTLLGLLITKAFVFAFQLGDGDICYAGKDGLEMVTEPEKILGVETHSLSRENAWEKAVTAVRRISAEDSLPAMFSLSTDGFANSYGSEEEFRAAVIDYLKMMNEHGAGAVEEHLDAWLSETSALGSGDDVTLLIAYFTPDEAPEAGPETAPEAGPETAAESAHAEE